MNNNKPTILIIFGVSGDLAKRYLLPSIGEIARANMMPEKFHIVGLTRQPNIEIDSLLKNTSNSEYLKEHISLKQIDVEKLEDYKKLDEYLKIIEKEFTVPADKIFYLSVPPTASRNIVEFLGESGLSKVKGTRLLLEKPFGTNLEDAKDLASHIDKYFKEEQVYRVDHYMAKETAQNIIVFRDGNSLFKKTWNKDFIKSIEITMSEAIGVEGRSNFYEQTGALRDIIQGHLIQLIALILMDLPENDKYSDVPSLRLKALKKLKIKNIKKDTIRAQYEGYQDEVGNPSSTVETFASITLTSKDKKWKGVPITLTTGKSLEKKFTEIKILYKKDREHESNELIIQLQPQEEIQFNMWAKRPGYEHRVSPHNLSFKYKEYYDVLPQAYEQVLFNAINSDQTLFTTRDEVVEAWRILDKLLKEWGNNKSKLPIYKKGSRYDEVIAQIKK